MKIEYLYGAKCPHRPTVAVSSYACRKCEHYAGHELDLDYHGRPDTVVVDCNITTAKEHKDEL